MTTAGIPVSNIEGGQLHIAYEYAYASELLMSRGDKEIIFGRRSGDVGAYIDVGVQGKVSVASASHAFKNSANAPQGSLLKAGRLAQENGRWVLYPEVVTQKGAFEERTPFLPQRAIVLTAEDEI